jgi:hypothetical protein
MELIKLGQLVIFLITYRMPKNMFMDFVMVFRVLPDLDYIPSNGTINE